mmetsp:Transcript_31533/g.48276  ORF Transcript_31533/g.48276 Transcript_31533/m.48276 type:complete len:130 (+) Transcript_31533:1-390(+)
MERRRASNRKSARKSRYRQLVMLDELQKSLDALKRQNNELKTEKNVLEREIKLINMKSDIHTKLIAGSQPDVMPSAEIPTPPLVASSPIDSSYMARPFVPTQEAIASFLLNRRALLSTVEFSLRARSPY